MHQKFRELSDSSTKQSTIELQRENALLKLLAFAGFLSDKAPMAVPILRDMTKWIFSITDPK
jgi:hypothetical protein